MAVDEALARHFDGTPVLRTYAWIAPTVSLGYAQVAAEAVDAEAVRAAGFGLVRRPTGGRAVLHDDEVTYCLIFGTDDPRFGGVARSQHVIGRALVEGLSLLGAGVEISAGRRSAPSEAIGPSPCFASPSRREITIGEKKVVGSAQRRFGSVALQHGSVLLGAGQNRLAAFVPGGGRQTAETGLRDIVGQSATFDRVAHALAEGFSRTLGVRFRRSTITGEESETARALRLTRYAADDWTYRK
jgi:lipoate-protein ligase A